MKEVRWLFPIILLLVSGCIGLQQKKFVKMPARAYHKIMVVLTLPDSFRVDSRAMEDLLVREMQSRHYPAVASLELYGEGARATITDEALVQLAGKDSADAILNVILGTPSKHTSNRSLLFMPPPDLPIFHPYAEEDKTVFVSDTWYKQNLFGYTFYEMRGEGAGYRAVIRYSDIASVSVQEHDSLVYKEMLAGVLETLKQNAVLLEQ